MDLDAHPKTERVMAALQGGEADQLPFAAWMHLATQHLEPRETAEAHERFFRAFDLDLMKVMNDYPYPLPDGTRQVDSVEAVRRFTPLDATRAFGRQLAVVGELRRRLGPELIILDTVFNAFGVAQVLLKRDFDDVRTRHPEDFRRLLQVIAESLDDYVRASLDAGASGIFFSVNGAAASLLGEDEFEAWVRAPDKAVLGAAAAAAMNVCHAHGDDPRLLDLLDYPVHAFSWSHLATAPSISAFREGSSACVIGGIDERSTIVRKHPSDIRADVERSVQEAGRSRFIVGPGCSLASETPTALIEAARLAARDG
jgi:uroporphyrinogen decarboxylase